MALFRRRRRFRENLDFSTGLASDVMRSPQRGCDTPMWTSDNLDQSRGRTWGQLAASLWTAVVLCQFSGPLSVAIAQSDTRGALPLAKSDQRDETGADGNGLPVPRSLQGEVSPYGAGHLRDRELPVAMGGFCAVTLNNQRQWKKGNERFWGAFDGRVYVFAGRREQAIFFADPQQYAPSLQGDCIVTYVEQGHRTTGLLRYGVVHRNRTYFFADEHHLRRFQDDPASYTSADIGCGGMCPVSLVDHRRRTTGIPAASSIHRGVRYYFASADDRARFLRAPDYYEQRTANRAGGSDGAEASSLQSQDGGDPPQEKMDKPTGSGPADEVPDLSHVRGGEPALMGYCPVSIADKQLWIPGKKEFGTEFDGQAYLLAGAEERTRFLNTPQHYIPVLGGDCPVAKVRSNLRVRGLVDYPAQRASSLGMRLYLFSNAEHLKTFLADPDRYTDCDLAQKGLCVVTLKEKGAEIAGNPQISSWHRGLRYLFTTEENRRTFENSPSSFVNLAVDSPSR